METVSQFTKKLVGFVNFAIFVMVNKRGAPAFLNMSKYSKGILKHFQTLDRIANGSKVKLLTFTRKVDN